MFQDITDSEDIDWICPIRKDSRREGVMTKRGMVWLVSVTIVAWGIGIPGCGDDGGHGTGPDAVATDLTGEADVPADAGDPGGAGDAGPPRDVQPDRTEDADVPADVPPGDVADAVTDAGGDPGLPRDFFITVERPDVGEPMTPQEVAGFTRRLVGFWKKTGYFQYVRDTSFGMHADAGLRDFQLWWTSVGSFWREGDTVVFGRLPETERGGGHNMMTRSAKVLAGAVAGHLLTGDPVMGPIVEQYCKGITATMVGMVHDDQDPVDWLMARNVVPPNHAYTLADGRKAAVDMDRWRSPYDNWNCSRFLYADNPEWGEVWVTNMRSKDDVSRLLKAVAYIRYAVEQSPDEGVRSACSEALEHVRAFSRDVVDHGYCIRTKDADGNIFCPGGEDDPVEGLKNERGDLASYVEWEGVIPGAECKSKLAHALVGYGEPLDNDCPREAWNLYEQMAVVGHYFNVWIIRSYHLSAAVQALVHRDAALAERMVSALVDRYEMDRETDPATYATGQDEWDRDLATSLMQAAAIGHPTSWDEARLIHKYVNRTIDRTADWPYWNPWAPGIEDGSHSYRPPDVDRMETTDEDDDEHWVRPEDMATVLEVCWSPFANPARVDWVDCDLVADPDRWDAAWVDDNGM